ncbi:MAG: NAD(P)H-hydrate epimerase [Naasia sp.]|uniref:NAD(P)H-hydrate epimerase n=1 Tax=Naasia sp. TaxID=2546198 RepID=UPI00263609BA|nr:NAD(P)H-hydrate epimerase [Naasia sp.]MCU1570584.1 NAD(P)H-hydrate epimerase [Naasia sp.]
MIEGYSAAQVRRAEQPHLDAGEPLMARAAAGLAAEIRAMLENESDNGTGTGTGRSRSPGSAPRLLLLVGPGNNAGDALFAGAELAAGGTEVTVVPVLGRTHAEGLAAAEAAGVAVLPPTPIDAVVAAARNADILVDGLFGTGSAGSPALRGAARAAVAALLPLLGLPGAPRVVAVDLPSGVDADTGEVPDPTVLPAEVTVTFGAVKAGLLRPPGRDYAGRLRLIDIGLLPELAQVEPLVRLPEP